jgi:hypothetical protein
MQSNPLMAQCTTETLPLKIIYVYDSDLDAPFHDSIFKIIKKYCHEANILLTSRYYNTTKYHEDCEYILSLPAFHVYFKNQYIDTFFADSKPLEDLRKILDKWRAEQNEKEIRKEKRRQAWKKTLRIFTLRSSYRCSQQKVSQPEL